MDVRKVRNGSGHRQMSEKVQKQYGRPKRSITLRHLSTPYHSEKILERAYYPPDSQNTVMGVMDTLLACVLPPFAPPSHSLSHLPHIVVTLTQYLVRSLCAPFVATDLWFMSVGSSHPLSILAYMMTRALWNASHQ